MALDRLASGPNVRLNLHLILHLLEDRQVPGGFHDGSGRSSPLPN